MRFSTGFRMIYFFIDLKFIYSWLLTKKNNLAYLKAMLIYVNFHKKNTYIYKRTIKNINIS